MTSKPCLRVSVVKSSYARLLGFVIISALLCDSLSPQPRCVMPENARPLMTLEALRSVPLFASLGDESAGALRELLELEVRPAGSVLFRKGERGGAMYLIEQGGVRIHLKDDDG